MSRHAVLLVVLFTGALTLGASCDEPPKTAPPPASGGAAPVHEATAFLLPAFAGVLDVEFEDAAGARLLTVTGDGATLKLKGSDGVERLQATAGKHGKVRYTAGGILFEVRDDDDDAGRFKIKSAAGETLLKIKRADGKLKIKAGDDGPELAVIKGDDDKRKLVVPPSDDAFASVKRSESGKFKVKGTDEAVIATMRSPQASSAPLVLAFEKAGVKMPQELRDVLVCELLRRGF